MLGVIHDMGGEGVEGEEVSHSLLLLPTHHFSLAHHVRVDDLLPWQEVVLHLLLSVVELHHELPD